MGLPKRGNRTFFQTRLLKPALEVSMRNLSWKYTDQLWDLAHFSKTPENTPGGRRKVKGGSSLLFQPMRVCQPLCQQVKGGTLAANTVWPVKATPLDDSILQDCPKHLVRMTCHWSLESLNPNTLFHRQGNWGLAAWWRNSPRKVVSTLCWAPWSQDPVSSVHSTSLDCFPPSNWNSYGLLICHMISTP